MISIEAFLALEASLANKLQLSYSKATASLFRRVGEALEAEDYVLADSLVQSFSMQPVLDENSNYITYLTNLSMLFGASRVSSTPGTSKVGLGFEKGTAFQIVEAFKNLLAVNGADFIKKQALQLIAMYRDSEGYGSIHKAETSGIVSKTSRVIHPFESFMDESGKATFNLASSLHTSRVSAWGFTSEAEVLGVEEYQINEQLDSRICPVCRVMHGKVFKVSDARRLLDVVVRASDPEELKQLQPWPSQSKDSVSKLREMSSSDLVSAGWHIPPFHAGCRGLLVRVGKSPSMDSIDGVKPNAPREITSEDFVSLGISPSAGMVSAWNSKTSVLPVEVASLMMGKLSDALSIDILAKQAKVSSSFARDYVTLSMIGEVYGVATFEQKLRIYNDMIESLAVTALPTKAKFLDMVKRAYLVAKDAGKSSLSIAKVEGFDLSNRGFVLVGKNWVLDLTNVDSMSKFMG